MGFFRTLFDDIGTGLGSFAADVKYESAKAEARKHGIDVDSLESEMYSSAGDCLEEEEVTALRDSLE